MNSGRTDTNGEILGAFPIPLGNLHQKSVPAVPRDFGHPISSEKQATCQWLCRVFDFRLHLNMNLNISDSSDTFQICAPRTNRGVIKFPHIEIAAGHISAISGKPHHMDYSI